MILYVHGISSHAAVLISKRKIARNICWVEHFWVNSFTKDLVVRRQPGLKFWLSSLIF